MKTHELANALRLLSTALKNGPNLDIEDFSSFLKDRPSLDSAKPAPSFNKADLPMALSALLSLSRIDKQEWIRLINDLGLQVEVRPRDASRDIVGKVLRVLEKDQDARLRLSKQVSNREVPASPELAKALSSLLSF